jgi:hypothetical protein
MVQLGLNRLQTNKIKYSVKRFIMTVTIKIFLGVLSTFLAGITNQKLEKSAKARTVIQIMSKAVCGEGERRLLYTKNTVQQKIFNVSKT